MDDWSKEDFTINSQETEEENENNPTKDLDMDSQQKRPRPAWMNPLYFPDEWNLEQRLETFSVTY